MNNDTDIGTLIEPAPVPFTFGAPGWYVVAVALGIVLVMAVALIWRHHRRNRYRREAGALLAQLQPAADANNAVFEANVLLKRVALRFAPREHIAPLRAQQWIDFLNDTAGRTLFTTEAIAILDGQYAGKVTAAQATSFVGMSRAWIRHHRAHKTKAVEPQVPQPKPAAV